MVGRRRPRTGLREETSGREVPHRSGREISVEIRVLTVFVKQWTKGRSHEPTVKVTDNQQSISMGETIVESTRVLI